MKLFEILADTHIDDQGRTVIKPRMKAHQDWPVGIKRQTIRPTKEEQDDENIAAIVARIGQIPIVSAYILPQKAKEGQFDARTRKKYTADDVKYYHQLKDALKQRNPQHVMDEEDIRGIARAAAEKITSLKGMDKALKGKRDDSVRQLLTVQRRLKSEDAILVPIASSSQLPMLVATEIAKTLNLPIVSGFEKRVGRTSKFYWTKKDGYQPRGDYGDDAEAELKRQEDEVNAMYKDSRVSPQQIAAAVEKLEAFRKKAARQSSKGRTSIDHRRGIYNIQEVVDEELLNLEDKDVIFVDDNVYTGLTFQGAFMALAHLGISPKTVSGITLHEFY